jgi:hypothetical protein
VNANQEETQASFFARFLAFTATFWSGAVSAFAILILIEQAFFFHGPFWPVLLGDIRGGLIPVAIAELFRSPVMGFLFAFLGRRQLNLRTVSRFGATCGALAYAGADILILSGRTDHVQVPLTEYANLGLPVILILLSRFRSVAEEPTR